MLNRKLATPANDMLRLDKGQINFMQNLRGTRPCAARASVEVASKPGRPKPSERALSNSTAWTKATRQSAHQFEPRGGFEPGEVVGCKKHDSGVDTN